MELAIYVVYAYTQIRDTLLIPASSSFFQENPWLLAELAAVAVDVESLKNTLETLFAYTLIDAHPNLPVYI